ncbi:coiled-coil domain-containing protein [Stecheria intestinalis]|uniref:coiled-coil domain-containing protein n=1 Tax=Stecheria intestinalis TaxID=2606630 RepID=UPI0023F4EF13|nr:hypothetical protein [Stecheria intestinalis]MDD5880982.1 hypothetical protein [Stecheria intestinalis]
MAEVTVKRTGFTDVQKDEFRTETGHKKEYKLTFADSTLAYDGSNISEDGIEITESLCSADNLSFSSVEIPTLSFTLINIDQNIKDLKEKKFSMEVTVSGVVTVPMGTWTITGATRNNDDLMEVKAEGQIRAFAKDVTTWWTSIVTVPITLRDLLISLCDYVGVDYSIPEKFTNSDMVITKKGVTGSGEAITGIDMLGYIQEAAAHFFSMPRLYNNGTVLTIVEFDDLYPSETLFPSDTLYPGKGDSKETYTGSVFTGDVDIADYTTAAIERVQIKGSANDVGAIAGSGSNTYIIDSNPLFYIFGAEDLENYAATILDELKLLTYVPVTANVKGLPYLVPGDKVNINTPEGYKVETILLCRTISGAQDYDDLVTIKGDRNREKVTAQNKTLKVVNRRIHEVINNVDILSSTISNVQEEVKGNTDKITENSTKIEQTATDISTVAKSVETVSEKVEKDSDRITSNENGLSAANDKITELTTKTTENETSIKQNAESIEANAKSVETIKTGLTEANTKISENSSAITQNAKQISSVVSSVETVSSKTDSNTKAIEANSAAISSANTKISENSSAITQTAANIMSTVSATYAGKGEIISVINQSAESIKISADKVAIETSDFTFGKAPSTVTMKTNSGSTGVSFEGSGTVDFNTKGKFQAVNINSSGGHAGSIINLQNDSSNSGRNYINIMNYRPNKTSGISMSDNTYYAALANSIYITSNGTGSNTLRLQNYMYKGGDANRIDFESGDSNLLYIANKMLNGKDANRIELSSGATGNAIAIKNYNSSGEVRSALTMNLDGSLSISTNTGGKSEITFANNGNLNIFANNDLVLQTTTNITVWDGSEYRAGAGGKGQGTKSDNPTLKNWDGKNVLLHFTHGLFTGYDIVS